MPKLSLNHRFSCHASNDARAWSQRVATADLLPPYASLLYPPSLSSHLNRRIVFESAGTYRVLCVTFSANLIISIGVYY